jgi:hypothetical protein
MSINKPGIPGKAQSKRPRQREQQASTTEEDEAEEENRMAEDEAQHLKLDGSESQQKEDKKITAEPVVLPTTKRKRKPPLVPWKKPKDMPRRPLSAYNIFFKDQREMLMMTASKSNVSRVSPGIGFANLAKAVAVKWKELPFELRVPYKVLADIEKDRYNKEMVVWRAKQKVEKEKAEKEKALLADDGQYTGVARRENSDVYSSSEAIETGPPPVADDQSSSRFELVARMRAEQEQIPQYVQSYRGVGSYTDRRSEVMYNPELIASGQHQSGEQPPVGQDSYRAPWSDAAHSLVANQVPRSNVQETHFSASNRIIPGSYPNTWFEVQQPRREAEIDDQGGGKRPARKRPEEPHPISSKQTNPDIDSAGWGNTERASLEPNPVVERPSVGLQQQGELAMDMFIDPFTPQVRDIVSSYERPMLATSTDLAQEHGPASASRDDAMHTPQTVPSLQQLGTRLGTETVDFLTSLKFSTTGGSSQSSEELQPSSK